MRLLQLLICVTLVLGPSNANVTSGELQALTDLYNYCGGANWVNSSNWLVGDPCSTRWYGVSCTNGHVTSLSLTTNGLFGSLQTSIGNLYALESINLGENELSSTIPPTFSSIKSIQSIELFSNQFSGQIPASLGDLLDYNLLYLDFSSNKLTGAIPSFFDNPPAAFKADLSQNLFTCPIPSWAAYTSATCVEWAVTTIDPLCVFPENNVNVYGQNFSDVTQLNCAFYNSTTLQLISQSVAHYVSPNHIICPVNVTFLNCDGTPGSQTFAVLTLKLTLQGQVVTGASALNISVVNYQCKFGSTVTINSVNYAIPNLVDVLSYCPLGNPTPFRCPTSVYVTSSTIVPSFDAQCTSANSNSTCLFAPQVSGTQQACFYYQCAYNYVCSLTSLCNSGYSSYGRYCYVALSGCTSQPNCH